MNTAVLVDALVADYRAALATGQTPAQIATKIAEFVEGNVAADISGGTGINLSAAVQQASTAILSACLAECYAEAHGLKPGGPLAAFGAAVAADTDLKAAAQDRLAQINALAASCPNLAGRCYLSAQEKQYLEAVLA